LSTDIGDKALAIISHTQIATKLPAILILYLIHSRPDLRLDAEHMTEEKT
jgi:hypothetical protein